MNEIQNPENPENTENSAAGDEPVKVKRRSIPLAIFLNFVAPGLGVYYTGKFYEGILIGIFWPIVLGIFIAVAITLPQELAMAALFILIPCLMAGLIAYTVHSARKNQNHYIVKTWNNPLFYILFFVVYTFYGRSILKSSVEAYRIPTSSMENSLLVGDYLLVNKNVYGIIMPFTNTKIINFNSPERNDVAVFIYEDKYEKSAWIKRVIGLPGDTIEIIDKELYVNGEPEEPKKARMYDRIERKKGFTNPRIFPKGAPWNEDNYGPLYIPRKNEVIKVNEGNIMYWRELILKDSEETSSKFISDVLIKGEYKIQNNYYFMLGDNRNNSLDSRFTGYVSEDDIIGKAGVIYFNTTNFSRIGSFVK